MCVVGCPYHLDNSLGVCSLSPFQFFFQMHHLIIGRIKFGRSWTINGIVISANQFIVSLFHFNQSFFHPVNSFWFCFTFSIYVNSMIKRGNPLLISRHGTVRKHLNEISLDMSTNRLLVSMLSFMLLVNMLATFVRFEFSTLRCSFSSLRC